jgi:plastocyanin
MISFSRVVTTLVAGLLTVAPTSVAHAAPASPGHAGGTRADGRGSTRLGLMLGAAAVAILVAACTSAAGAPAFTYGPTASSAASMPGMDMSPSASGPGGSVGAPASAPASPAPAAGGSPASAGATLHISAQNIAFDTDHLAAAAGQAFVLEFDNNDAGIPHNVEIKNAGGTSMFKGQIITGPAKVSYQVPALPAGSYMFVCDVHPNMTGTLTVQ